MRGKFHKKPAPHLGFRHVRALSKKTLGGDFHDNMKKPVTATVHAVLFVFLRCIDARNDVDFLEAEGGRRSCHLGANQEPACRAELRAFHEYPH